MSMKRSGSSAFASSLVNPSSSESSSRVKSALIVTAASGVVLVEGAAMS